MKLQQIQIRQRKPQPILAHIKRYSTPILQGVKTMAFIHIKAKNRVQTVKGAVKLYATKTALRISKTMAAAKAILRKAQEYKTAFTLSLKAVTLERAILAKKQLLKYGYSFEKIVDVAKAYMALRSFKLSLGRNIVNLIF